MDLKKFFRYFLLPMIAILLIPYFIHGEAIDKTRIILAAFSGVFLGIVRLVWDKYQQSLHKTDY